MSTTASRSVRDVLGTLVTRTAALPPATGASDDLFSITGGVLITGFYGLVTAAIPDESLDWTVDFDPDDGGSDVALATLLAVDNTAVGSWFSLPASTGGALEVDVDVSDAFLIAAPLAMYAGDIKLTCAGGGAIGTTARVQWSLTYLPLTSTGAVVAV